MRINWQLPLGLLNAAQGHPMLVELKNGETLNGHLVLCDTWMNLTLREVVQTSPVSLSDTPTRATDPR
jgi:U6 snRNA-associated Sm-like protein LSm4